MLKIEGARPRGYSLIPGPRWRSASCPKKPALGHGYEAKKKWTHCCIRAGSPKKLAKSVPESSSAGSENIIERSIYHNEFSTQLSQKFYLHMCHGLPLCGSITFLPWFL